MNQFHMMKCIKAVEITTFELDDESIYYYIMGCCCCSYNRKHLSAIRNNNGAIVHDYSLIVSTHSHTHDHNDLIVSMSGRELVERFYAIRSD